MTTLEEHAAIGDRVRALRKRRGWSQEGLAGASGLSKPTVQDVERPKEPKDRHPGTLQAIADALGVPLSKILDIEDAEPEPGPRERLRVVITTRDIVRWAGKLEHDHEMDREQSLDVIESILKADDERYASELERNSEKQSRDPMNR